MVAYRWTQEVGAALIVLQTGFSGLAFAQSGAAVAGADAAHRAVQATAGSKPVCVDAEIDGVRTLSYDCLSRQLTPPAAIADGAASQSAAEALAKGPSNRVGTFNLSAEQNRFGANWGKSAFPQRPPPLQVVPIGR